MTWTGRSSRRPGRQCSPSSATRWPCWATPGRARLLLPRARAYAGLNLLGAEFVAPLGSADRTIAQIESVLGLASAEDPSPPPSAMDRQMNAPLHEATTMAEHAAHRRRRGAPPADVEAVAGPARDLARSHGWRRYFAGSGLRPTSQTPPPDRPPEKAA